MSKRWMWRFRLKNMGAVGNNKPDLHVSQIPMTPCSPASAYRNFVNGSWRNTARIKKTGNKGKQNNFEGSKTNRGKKDLFPRGVPPSGLAAKCMSAMVLAHYDRALSQLIHELMN